jgi:hypothetical protein
VRDLVPETQLVCLCDCEADIYELLATAAKQAADQPRVESVIRSQFDRTGEGSLRAFVQQQPVLGEVEFQVTPTRVWFAKRCGLKAPAGKESWAPWVSTTAIFLTESRPGEAPVEWLLLSSQPVLAAAVETVKGYLCRWEVYFRIYKNGCRGFSLKSASTWNPPWPCT